MDKFWELLEQSVLISGVITLLIVITCCYMFATGQSVPELLAYAFTTIIGFFFGAKVTSTAQRRAR